MYPCYRDVDDKTTLEFWLIYHETSKEKNKTKKKLKILNSLN